MMRSSSSMAICCVSLSESLDSAARTLDLSSTMARWVEREEDEEDEEEGWGMGGEGLGLGRGDLESFEEDSSDYLNENSLEEELREDASDPLFFSPPPFFLLFSSNFSSLITSFNLICKEQFLRARTNGSLMARLAEK
uniref:Uncharacterized protein n=1 Tax=Ananas comosus var. bracteatus TaxID=296719 RepID=A0A6V7NKW5_ANACO|nr:unnamed protein product [Ananas comosus var. bracteatus]